MARYPYLVAYHQTDPRGCSLYILHDSQLGPDSQGMPTRRPEDVYSSGVPVV
jgi:hypothetical protein